VLEPLSSSFDTRTWIDQFSRLNMTLRERPAGYP
jgi:hypothetical protein